MKDKTPVAKPDSRVVEIWSKVIDVQMHFNDIEMKIRNFALSVVLAVFAAYGFLMSHEMTFVIGQIKIHFFAVVPLLGCVAVYLFYFMDFYWYHRLLLGAVKHGMQIEERHAQSLPELGITKIIGSTSPVEPTGPLWLISRLLVSDPRFKGEGKLHSDAKIKLFYYTIIWFMILLSIVSMLVGGLQVCGLNLINWLARSCYG